MKLYYAPGACSMASRIALYELGENADFVLTDIRAKRTEDGRDYREINPLGYVPSLQFDDGSVLHENTAILPYLANLRPGTLGPSEGGMTEARFHEALGFLSGELHKAFSPMFANPQGEAREAALTKLHSRLAFVNQHLGDGREHWLGGDFTVADAYAFVILNWAGKFSISYDDYPAIKRYVANLRERETVQRALADEGLLQPAA